MALVTIVLATVFLPWTWSDQLASLGGDSAVYMLSARHYAPYLPADPVWQAADAGSPYPPLYPLLLVLSGGAADPHLAHAATTLCLLAAFIAFYAWLIAIGLGRSLSIATVVLFACLPGTVQQAMQLHSESLYLALSLAGLALLARPAQPGRQAGGWRVAATFAAAVLTRTAGIALLAAFLPAMLRERRLWPGAGLLLAAAAPAALWSLGWRGSQQGYGQGFLLYGGKDWTEIAAALVRNGNSFVEGMVLNVLQAPAFEAVALAVILLAAVVAVVRLLRGCADAWYVGAYLFLMTVWPYPAEAQRFAWVLMPLVLGYAVWGAQQAARRRAGRAGRLLPVAGPWVVWLALALPTAVAFTLAMQRAFHPLTREVPGLRHLPEWYGPELMGSLRAGEFHLGIAESLRVLGNSVPEGECILSIKPSTVAYYTHHVSKSPPGPNTDDSAFEAELARMDCRYLLLLDAASPSYPQPYYPATRLRGRLEMVESRTKRIGESQSLAVALARLRDGAAPDQPGAGAPALRHP